MSLQLYAEVLSMANFLIILYYVIKQRNTCNKVILPYFIIEPLLHARHMFLVRFAFIICPNLLTNFLAK